MRNWPGGGGRPHEPPPMNWTPNMHRYLSLLLVLLLASFSVPATPQNQTQNVILITLDGARSQEIFGGLDLEVLKSITREGRIEDAPLYKEYWAPTPAERRQKVMPFFWGTLMRQYGSIAGDRALGSTVQITNGHRFSYPGYSEILTGEAHDQVIDSNDKKRNPYTTVLEFLRRKLGLSASQVACFASWDVIGWIATHDPAAISINAGYAAYDNPEPGIKELSRLQFETVTPWTASGTTLTLSILLSPISSDINHACSTSRLARQTIGRTMAATIVCCRLLDALTATCASFGNLSRVAINTAGRPRSS